MPSSRGSNQRLIHLLHWQAGSLLLASPRKADRNLYHLFIWTHGLDREDNHVGSQMLPCRQRSASLALRQELPQQVIQGGDSESLLARPPWAGCLAYWDLSFSICKTRTITVFSTKLSHCEDYIISKWESTSVTKLGIQKMPILCLLSLLLLPLLLFMHIPSLLPTISSRGATLH